MKQCHNMPFGAAVAAGGMVEFGLWAPAARTVAVCLVRDGGEDVFPMAPAGDGWFRLPTEQAKPGDRYLYLIDGIHRVPDPASRFQPEGVHGPSEVIDPNAWQWRDTTWTGRPWEAAVVYELHAGAFTATGDFRGVNEKLDYLAELGVTAVELMPVAAFPGGRDWGYNGVLPFAPYGGYGRPDDLKALVAAAHQRGLMVLLDVVYNHFGPEGNYLHRYAPAFFSNRHHTPWGAALNFDGEHSRWVREFFIHNALYWLEEYRFDGLRLDAVHAIIDDSRPHILDALAAAVHDGPGKQRQVHLVLENDDNAARYLERCEGGEICRYAAQWNDDLHHAVHVRLTGETAGYYCDYADTPLAHLGRCLCEGFAYQGERSVYRERKRGESTASLPVSAFVNFLQNHDQVGNRAFGERINALAPPAAVRCGLVIILLAPAPPLLFMGQEWGCDQPFPFFCDFGPELAAATVAGRRREFAAFPAFRDPEVQARIPDPGDPATFAAAVLDWSVLTQSDHQRFLDLHKELLALRHRHIVPRLAGTGHGRFDNPDGNVLDVRWILGDGAELRLLANMGEERAVGFAVPGEPPLFALEQSGDAGVDPWWAGWWLQSAGRGDFV